MYHFEIEKLPLDCPAIQRWCLDFPQPQQSAELTTLSETGVWFQGWVLAKDPARHEVVQLYLQQGVPGEDTNANETIVELNKKRPDVIETVLSEPAEEHVMLQCGFRFQQVLTHGCFELGFMVNERRYPVVKGQVKGPFEILRGKDNWLFLDNDSNQSVSQHTGVLKLSAEAKSRWKAYFGQTTKLMQHKKFALLVAPAKEAVYSDEHPMPRAEVTAVEEMCALAPAGHPLVYPVDSLKALSQRTFRVTDTHWSAHGARHATERLVGALGLDISELQARFSEDPYVSKRVGGDLGNKYYPPIKADEDVLQKGHYRRSLRYDNGLPNFGRVLVVTNKRAVFDKRLVLFGSSSAYSMLNYLHRSFRELVLIHSAGNIDSRVIDAVDPDYVAAQTNGRFVVQAPSADYDLTAVMVEKLSALSPDARQSLIETASKTAAKRKTTSVHTMHEFLIRAASDIR